MEKMIVGNKIPTKYFITSGIGESDITIHAGSYDVALRKAGIANCNIVYYSSILPRRAERIKKPRKLEFGSVVDAILADCTTSRGVRATAGLGIAKVYKNKEYQGGLVAEYSGNAEEDVAKEELKNSLDEMFGGRYRKRPGFEMGEDLEFIVESFVPKKKHGTAIVAICFVEYILPVVNEYDDK